MTTKSRRRWTCFALLAVLAVAGPYLYWAKVEYRLLTVVEGKVYRSAAMPPAKLLRVTEELGIKTVIDLRTPGPKVEAERAALEGTGVTHLSLPSGTTPDPPEWEAVLAAMRATDEPILFHCTHGIGRAAIFEAIYRMEFQDWSPEDARKSAYIRSGLGSFGPESRRGRFILEYPNPSENL